MMSYTYTRACTDCYGDHERQALDEMIHGKAERDISQKTFMRHCGESAREVFSQLGYARHPRQGLTAAGDWHISYHRSKWDGRRCYFFKWSAIEHIFEAQP